MTLRIFDHIREIIPDVNETFLRNTIRQLAGDLGVVDPAIAARSFFDQIPIGADITEQFSQLLIEKIFNEPYPLLGEAILENGPVAAPPLLPVAAPLPIPNGNSDADDDVDSGGEINDGDDLDHMVDRYRASLEYTEEAKRLLLNEFPWFYKADINRALVIGHGDNRYTRARAFLKNLIRDFVGNFNLDSVNPLNPTYPHHLRRFLIRDVADYSERLLIRHPEQGVFHLLQGGARATRNLTGQCSNRKLLQEINSITSATTVQPSAADASLVSPGPTQIGQGDCGTTSSEENSDDDIECQCCFVGTAFKNMTQCQEGHLFCQGCLKEYVSSQVEIGTKNGYLECMENECKAPILRASLNCVPPETLKRLDERIAAFNINASGLENMVRCPKCQSQYQLEDNVEALTCGACQHSSCRKCQQPWREHVGKTCAELSGENEEARIRRQFEEKMSEAVIRPCPKCKTGIVKIDGCNKMKCQCGGTLCYLCRKPNIDYNHFCTHPTNPGQPCTKCQRCMLWDKAEVKDAAELKRLEAEAQEKLRQAKLNQPSTSSSVPSTPLNPSQTNRKRRGDLSSATKDGEKKPRESTTPTAAIRPISN